MADTSLYRTNSSGGRRTPSCVTAPHRARNTPRVTPNTETRASSPMTAAACIVCSVFSTYGAPGICVGTGVSKRVCEKKHGRNGGTRFTPYCFLEGKYLSCPEADANRCECRSDAKNTPLTLGAKPPLPLPLLHRTCCLCASAVSRCPCPRGLFGVPRLVFSPLCPFPEGWNVVSHANESF